MCTNNSRGNQYPMVNSRSIKRDFTNGSGTTCTKATIVHKVTGGNDTFNPRVQNLNSSLQSQSANQYSPHNW
jgi:hypothetical protein